jgi:hypothetical protein
MEDEVAGLAYELHLGRKIEVWRKRGGELDVCSVVGWGVWGELGFYVGWVGKE